MLVLHDGNPLVRIRRPWVNHGFILLILLGFGAQYLGLFVWQVFAFFPHQVFTLADGPGPFYGLVGLVSHMFLHGGWLHIAGNLIALWVFGDNIEDAMGHGRYLLFVLLTGAAAALTQGWLGHPFAPMIGASGAVSAVMGAYLLLHPRARILMLAFNVVPILAPASVVVGIDLLLNIVMAWDASVVGGAGSAGVAWFAHIGGFVSGIVLLLLFRSREVRILQPAPPTASRIMRGLARVIPTLMWPGDKPVVDDAVAPAADGTAAVRRAGWMAFVKAAIYIVLIFLLMRYFG